MNIKNLELFNNNLVSGFLKSLQAYPDNSALWVNGQEYSYIEFYRYVKHIANAIGSIDSERCLICSNRTWTDYASILASLFVGKTYVPINPQLPIERNVNILQQVDSNLMILDEHSIKYASELLSRCEFKMNLILVGVIDRVLIDELTKKHNVICIGNVNDFDDVLDINCKNNVQYAYLLFTSGSTGVPKGVPVKHSNIMHYIKIFAERTNPNQFDKFIQLADLTFDFSVHDCFAAWEVGACLYVFPNNQFLGLADFVIKHKITFWGSVPSVATLLLDLNRVKSNQLTSLRYSMFCGEALSQALAHSWKLIAPNSIIENFYGPTEAAVCFTGYTWDRNLSYNANEHIVPIGRPFKNLEILLVDDRLNIVENNAVGEMLLGGPQVVDQYWNNDEITRKSFITLSDKFGISKKWYRTGDLAKFDENGDLLYKGRCDDQIQIRGGRAEKLEIETLIKKIANTQFVAVIPWPYANDGTILGVIAYLSDTSITKLTLITECRKYLPDYMVPSEFHYLNKLPYNANNKVDYHILKQMREKLKSGGAD